MASSSKVRFSYFDPVGVFGDLQSPISPSCSRMSIGIFGAAIGGHLSATLRPERAGGRVVPGIAQTRPVSPPARGK
jgi:hypothetical protein